MIRRDSKDAGFTLVELMLAMVFLSFLLISIALTLSDLLRDYSKGNSIKQMNQTARSTIEDMTRSIRGAKASTINQDQLSNNRLCLFGTSYIWNLGEPPTTPIINTFSGSSLPYRLIQVNDPVGNLCLNPALQPAYDDSIILLADGIIIQKLNIEHTPDKRLFKITLQLSTDGAEAPVIPATPTTDAQCDTDRDGDFCAVTTFQTVINTQEGVVQ